MLIEPEIPIRLTEAEVLNLTGWTKNTLSQKMWQRKFPKKVTSSKRYGRVFSGVQVYKALGFIQDKEADPFYDAIDG